MTGVFVFEYAFPLLGDNTAPQVLAISIDVKASSEAEAKQLADQQVTLVNREQWTRVGTFLKATVFHDVMADRALSKAEGR